MAGKIEGLGLAVVDDSFRIAVRTIKMVYQDMISRRGRGQSRGMRSETGGKCGDWRVVHEICANQLFCRFGFLLQCGERGSG